MLTRLIHRVIWILCMDFSILVLFYNAGINETLVAEKAEIIKWF